MRWKTLFVAFLYLLGSAVYGAAPVQHCDSGRYCNPAVPSPRAQSPTALLPVLQSLTTLFLSNNWQDGNMFDVKANTTLTIQSFDINISSESPVLIEVYYKVGTSVGYDQNPSAWSLLGSATVTPQGTDVPTHLPVGGLTIPAGATYGLYVTDTSGHFFRYTDGTTDYSNSDLTIYHGYGKAYPFGATFSPRIWNGTIYYTLSASSYDLSFQDDYGRSDLCVNSATGAWQYTVLKGNGAGQTFSGPGTVVTGSGYMRLEAAPGSGYGLTLIYYTAAHRATATFTYRPDAVSSALYDANTLDDEATCGEVTQPTAR